MTIYLDGAYNAASGTRDAFAGLSAELVAAGYPEIPVTEGDREYATQLAYWNERMVRPGDENGRRVYRRVWWQGILWSQIHPWAVAPPGTGNHESRRSNDLGWPYNDASTDAHKAAQRFAPNHNITWEGRNFDEDWHWTFWGALGVIGTTTTTAPTPQEEDDMLFIRIKAANLDHYAVIGNGVFRHFVAGDPYEWIKNASRTDDNWVDVTLDRLPALLRTYGCDLHIWDVRDGQFVVLDPLTGNVGAGNLWSAINVLRSQVEQVKVTSEQTAAYVAELAAAA